MHRVLSMTCCHSNCEPLWHCYSSSLTDSLSVCRGAATGKICKPDSPFINFLLLKHACLNGRWVPIVAPAPESRDVLGDSKMDGQWRYLGLYKCEKKGVKSGPHEYRRLSEEVRVLCPISPSPSICSLHARAGSEGARAQVEPEW